MQSFEKLGEFYLGKVLDQETMQKTDQYYLLSSKDLTTHAVIVGMTGSGKTGLSIDLIEEAAMDNVPAIIIDPKGDMGNLALAFPEFKADNYKPWLEETEAEKLGKSLDEYAESIAEKWQMGLADDDIDGNRIKEYLDKVDISIYTPGSSAGKKLSIVDFADIPSNAILSDSELLQDYINSTVSSILALLNVDADPLNSPEHILLSNILLNNWTQHKNVDLAKLITQIQDPDFDRIGVMPLETIYPADKRFKLAMKINNLIASPSFATWLEGENLNIQNLLYTSNGKAKISIISINHLDESARMFFVSIFMNKLLSWTRSQSGTSSLRALLYMDEIYGYFPPVSNPPSKKPLLTLLKQARAYGLGIVLATQNPSDLDYKGLSNIGSWFIGRLQTEQDKARLLDGLQTASIDSGTSYSREELENLIARLPKRSFLVNNIHTDGPELFSTRWAMSYLAGPLTRKQIEILARDDDKNVANNINIESKINDSNNVAHRDMHNYEEKVNSINNLGSQVIISDADSNTAKIESEELGNLNNKPEVNSDIAQYYLPVAENTNEDLIYLPSLLAYVDTSYNNKLLSDTIVKSTIWNTLIKDDIVAVDWSDRTGAELENTELLKKGVDNAIYANIEENLTKKTSFNKWGRDLIDLIYNNQPLELYRNNLSKLISKVDEKERDFAARVQLLLREQRDFEVEDLKKKYKEKMDKLEEKIRKAKAKIEKEEGQANHEKFNTFVNLGTTILDAFTGRKRLSKTTINKAARTARSVSRAGQQSGDVSRAEDDLANLNTEIESLESELEQDIERIQAVYDDASKELELIKIAPTKSNINIRVMAVLWLPFKEEFGSMKALYKVKQNN